MSVEPDVDAVEIRYPPDLPVSQRKDEIAAAIRDHQVVIVAGETGSGKTTQIPKICLELGRGRAGLIGHTQPRRIAARSVAERIASELGTELGQRVGYTVRFTDQVSRGTQVRLMTDGILLAEIQRDPTLRRYDTIIVDEAHERSLNIDFILGYLHQLLPRRPDLKVIITSATIDSARFSEHFGGAPVVEVSGRTYPVEVRYRPVHDPDARPGTPEADPDRDQISAIVDGVAELQREGDGDVLVFLSGEREIRDTADGLRDAVSRKQIREVDVLPLYARLSAAEQHRVFASHSGPAGRARHQRGRDLAHRPGHPLRHRPRHRPDLAVLVAHQGAATPDRAGVAGLGSPAGGPVRPRRRRHLPAALHRGGLRRPPRVHRPGDPAHQPRLGDPADDRDRSRRRRGVPVRRAAGRARGPRRHPPCSRSCTPSRSAAGRPRG